MEKDSTKFFIKNKDRILSFAKFALSSMTAALIDMAVFQFLCFMLRGSFESKLYAGIATVIARVVSSTYNYLINYFVVFKSKEKHLGAVVKYAGQAALKMVLSAVVTTYILSLVATNFELFVKIPVDVALFFLGYVIQKLLVFRNNQ